MDIATYLERCHQSPRSINVASRGYGNITPTWWPRSKNVAYGMSQPRCDHAAATTPKVAMLWLRLRTGEWTLARKWNVANATKCHVPTTWHSLLGYRQIEEFYLADFEF